MQPPARCSNHRCVYIDQCKKEVKYSEWCIATNTYVHSVRESWPVLSEGTKFDNICFVDEGIEDPNTTINGPLSSRQQNTIQMVFRWRADDGPILNAGLVAL